MPRGIVTATPGGDWQVTVKVQDAPKDKLVEVVRPDNMPKPVPPPPPARSVMPPPPPQAVYAPPLAAQPAGTNNTRRTLLIGCGCLILILIVVAIVAVRFIRKRRTIVGR